MHRPFLVGEQVYLRPLEESDVNEEYLSWLNDSETTRYLETGKFPNTNESLRGYLQRFEGSTTDLAFAIIDKQTEQHIGNVTLNRISWIHRTGDTGLMIGRKDFWGRGIAFETWSLIIEYAFNRLGLRKIIAGCNVNNVASLAVLRMLGFHQEGLLRREVFVDGEYLDGIRLGMFREEFHKFLKESDSVGLPELP